MSITFNNTDLSTYNLRAIEFDIPTENVVDWAQTNEKGYAAESKNKPKYIVFEVVVTGTSLANVVTNLDSVKKYLQETQDAHLEINAITDRYWEARFVSLAGNFRGTYWEGALTFLCLDPLAYKNTGTAEGSDITTDPQEITITPGGTGRTRPLITLTCDDTLIGTTVSIEHTTEGQTVEWTGDLVPSDVLIFDCERWLVTLNDVSDMANVEGEFPYLVPGANVLSVAGFSGSYTVAWTDRYH